jgi:hypothetical protein
VYLPLLGDVVVSRERGGVFTAGEDDPSTIREEDGEDGSTTKEEGEP